MTDWRAAHDGRCFGFRVFVALGCALVISVGPATKSLADEPAEAVAAQALGRETNLPLPRFVSLKKSRANARVGPGPNYPVRWVYLRAGLPVEIIAEHDNWRKIRDQNGDEGWVYHALVNGRRTAVVRDQQATLWRKAGDEKNDVIAYLDPDVIVGLQKCDLNRCRVEVDNVKGWVDRTTLWGLYDDEVLD